MDAHALSKGTRVAEFEILGVRGLGGFGIVYLALDHSLQRQVAIKEYLPGQLAHRDGTRNIVPHSAQQRETFDVGLRGFIQEARLLAQFNHPALVKVFRFWEANGTAYMATAFYEGVTLKSAYADTRPGQEEITQLIAPLLDAVEVMHRANCFHRDIAPDNVIVQPGGEPVLLDFGAARRIIGEMTQALTVVLKSGYAPIEQYADDNAQAQGPWTDVYALGAMIHWMIRGKSPPAAVMRVVRDTYVPLARDAPPGFDQQFLAGVDRALAMKAEDRPQSIAELRTVLGIPAPKPASASRSFTAPPEPDGEATVLAPHPRDGQRARERRRRVALFSAIVAAACVLTVLIVLNVLGPIAPEPKVVATESKASPASVPVAPLLVPAPAPVPAPEAGPAAAPTPPAVNSLPLVAPSEAAKSAPAPPPTAKAAVVARPATGAVQAPASAAKSAITQPTITDPKEQYELARNLQRGIGVEKNPSEAIVWLRRSADQDYTRAQLALGKAYENGDGVTKDAADAFGWYRRAAVRGNVEAQVKVAQYYKDGIGVAKDVAEALVWYGRAADKGNAEAKDWIVRLQSEPKAAATKDSSAKATPSSAQVAKAPTSIAPPPTSPAQQYELGLDYWHGRNGVAVDRAEGMKWLRAAADQGSGPAQNALGLRYKDGLGVATDYAEARKWFEKGATNGNGDALNNLGHMYLLGQGMKANDVLAADYFRKSANTGNAWGMRNLAWSLENGRGVFRDLPAAVELYRKSASAGNTDAMFQLGRLYERGEGVKKDDSEALRWFRLAATGGHKAAGQRVAQLEVAKK